MDQKPTDSKESPNQTEASKKEQKHMTFMKALGISTEFGFVIVLPLLVFTFVGRWLDNRYDKNYFVLLGIVLALLTSSIWLFKVIGDLLKEFKDK
jgi:4-amino-4-deoxy-L-arabinose transferase-like glycosyltransferase